MRRILAVVAIAAGSVAMTTTQVQAAGETVVGTVTDEANAPVIGAQVQRISGGCPFVNCLIETQITGPGGTFSYPDAPVAQYTYHVTPPANRPDLVEWWSGGVLGQFRNGAPYQTIPTVPNGVTTVNITDPSGGQISGRITHPDGTGVANATVRGLIGTVSFVTTTTSADGTYTLGGMPANDGLVGSAPSQYTLVIQPAVGDGSVTAGTLPSAGTYTIVPGTAISDADLELPGAIAGTFHLWQAGARVTSIAPYTGGGLCPAPAVWSLSGFCPALPPQQVSVTDNNTSSATAHGGPYPPGTYTVRGISYPSVESPVWATITIVAGDSFDCDLPLDNSIAPACIVTHGGGSNGSNGADGVSDADENSIGDGNGDGTPDSAQANVTSLPGAFGERLTIAAPPGSTITAVTATDPASLPGAPDELDMTTSVIGYSVWTVPGATVAVTLRIADPTGALTQLWKYNAGAGWTDATDLATSRTHLADGRTEFVLALTDGGAGDSDGSANGVVVDPIGFGSASYDFRGFRAPIDAQPSVNRAKAGSTVPVKWVLFDTDGQPVSDPTSFESIHLVKDTCPSGANFDDIEVLASGTGLTYHGNGLWQYDWKTSTGWVGCGQMVLKLTDGSIHIALFLFR